MPSLDRKDQFEGCLIGCAIGDAVGAPVEAKDYEHCQKYVQNYVRPKNLRNIRRPALFNEPSYPFGQVTDDTQLTMLLALSIVQTEQADPQYFGNLLAKAFEIGAVVGSGRATRQAVVKLSRGVPWDQAGTPPPMAGNGTAMRAAPLGMLFYRSFDPLVQAAYETSMVTHQAPICAAGATAIAMAVAKALQRTAPEEPHWLADVQYAVAKHSQRMATQIGYVWEHRADPPDTMSEYISQYSEPTPGTGSRVWDRISPYVLPSVLWSLYAFLHTPDDFWETICTAVCPGGDVDTTGAMAGAISGAYNGSKALPEDIVGLLQDRGSFVTPFLQSLADAIYTLAHRSLIP